MPDPQISYQGESSVAVLRRVPMSATRILDVGCGSGGNARVLSLRGQCVDGITLSPQEAEDAKAYCAKIYAHDLETGLPPLPAEQLYDAVICSHVLEHIVQPEALLTDVRAHLAPSGVLIIALPNLMLWKSRLRLMLGDFEYTESGLMDRTHVRWYSFASARRLLERNGFSVIEAVAEGGLPLGPVRRVLPKWLLEPADRAACRAAPGLLGYEMLYVARAA
ncbi:MAG: class SAM-dependent methyltransferase [Rhodospirillales bacterium]|nr:class SAM-dependent methyltransferase [Rhodospirillales bacterium]